MLHWVTEISVWGKILTTHAAGDAESGEESFYSRLFPNVPLLNHSYEQKLSLLGSLLKSKQKSAHDIQYSPQLHSKKIENITSFYMLPRWIWLFFQYLLPINLFVISPDCLLGLGRYSEQKEKQTVRHKKPNEPCRKITQDALQLPLTTAKCQFTQSFTSEWA